MSKVLILVETSQEGIAPSTIHMISALSEAIITSSDPSVVVQVVTTDTFGQTPDLWIKEWDSKEVLICPLTLIPPNLPLEISAVHQACRDVLGLRQRVAKLGCAVADGSFWLPVVLTAKGPLYGEVIGINRGKRLEELSSDSYYQPFHLIDAKRQQAYQLGQYLMSLLALPAATYLIQFGFQGSEVCFDRLWPFPATPAIASLGVQEPNLFACHWYCLANMPVFDLTIIPAIAEPS